MTIVGGFDVHRAQITYDYLDTSTGEVATGQIRPATRSVVRKWLVQRFEGSWSTRRAQLPGPAPVEEDHHPDPAAAARTDDLRSGERAVVRFGALQDVDLGVVYAVIRVADSHLADTGVQCLLLDLGAVTFLDSTGMGALLAIRKAAKKQGKDIVLGDISERIRQLLAITRLDSAFQINSNGASSSDSSVESATDGGNKIDAPTDRQLRLTPRRSHRANPPSRHGRAPGPSAQNRRTAHASI